MKEELKDERVLIVDDEEVIREVCAQILEAEGCRVTTAATADEALRLVDENSFDAVVTDIMMPDMSGLELLQALAGKDGTMGTVVITGMGTSEMASRSDSLGAGEFVVKPFTPNELSEAVRKALERRPAA